MDWLGKAIEVLKLPLKYIWAVAVTAGFLLFAPEAWLDKLNLAHLSQEFSTTIGLVFLGSAVLVGVNIISGIWNWNIGKRNVKKWAEVRSKALKHLDPKEKAVLREFFLKDQNTLPLPIDQATVAGLLNKGFLQSVSSMREKSLAGILSSLIIVPEVKNQLTHQMLNLPEGDPSESDKEFLRKNRPDFMSEIDHHMDLFHSAERIRPWK